MSSLSHHGIKGQRWGVRRFQNKDGTRTSAGKKRYSIESVDVSSSRKEIKKLVKGFSRKDKEFFFGRRYWDDEYDKGSSEDEAYFGVKKRFVIREGKDIVAFIDAQQTSEWDSELNMVIGTKASARGKGYASALAEKMVDWYDSEGYRSHEGLRWQAANENTGSRKIAEKTGFKQIDDDGLFDDEAVYAYSKTGKQELNKLAKEYANKKSVGKEVKDKINSDFKTTRISKLNPTTEIEPYGWVRSNKGESDWSRMKANLVDSYAERWVKKKHADDLSRYDEAASSYGKARSDYYKKRKAKHTSIGGTMYIEGNALILGDSSYLEHHGILGQKWGVRRFQNKDGTRTAAGKAREDRRVLKKGSMVYRVHAAPKDYVYDNKKYVSTNIEDHNKWADYFGNEYAIRWKPVYYQRYKTKKDLYVATGKDIVDVVSTKLDKQMVKRDLDSLEKEVKLRGYDWDNTSKEDHYSMLLGAQKESGKQIVHELQKMGFGAIEDDHGKNVAKDPVIVLDPDKKLRRYGKTAKDTRYLESYRKAFNEFFATHTSIGGTMYIEGNALILGDSSYLEHHGIRGQRWGVRRFQNRDGSLTNAGRKRLGYATKGATQAVKKAFKAGVKTGTKAVKAAKAHHEKAEAKKIEKKKEKASKTRAGVSANKDLFTAKELKELNSKFEEQDKLTMARLKRGVEIAKAVGETAKSVGEVGKAYEALTGHKLVPDIVTLQNGGSIFANDKDKDKDKAKDKDDDPPKPPNDGGGGGDGGNPPSNQPPGKGSNWTNTPPDLPTPQSKSKWGVRKKDSDGDSDLQSQMEAAKKQASKAMKDAKLQEYIDAYNRDQNSEKNKELTARGQKAIEILSKGGGFTSEEPKPSTPSTPKSAPSSNNLMAQIRAAQAKLEKPNKNETPEEHREAQQKVNQLERLAKTYNAQVNKPGADPAEVTEKLLKKNKDILDGIKHMDFRDDIYLEHHGVKGMKWGKHLMAGKGGDLYEGTALGAGGGGGPMTEEERKKAEALRKKKLEEAKKKAEEAAKEKEIEKKAKEIGISAKAYKRYSIDNNRLPGKHHYNKSQKLHGEASSSVAEAQAADRQAHMNRAKAASLNRKVNSSHMFDADGYHISQQRGDDRKEAKRLQKEAKQLDAKSKKALKKFYKKRYKADKERQKWQNSTSGKYHHLMRHCEIQNGVLFVDSFDGLTHHGIKGQRWGVRRFQNEDGSLTPKGRKHYEKKIEKLKRKQVSSDAIRGTLERQHPFAVTGAAVLGAVAAGMSVAATGGASVAMIAAGSAISAAVSSGLTHASYSASEAWEGRGTRIRKKKIAKYENMLKQSDMEEGMYHVENGTLFINAGEPYLEHHGVLGMKWGKHLRAGKGPADAPASAGGGAGEDDEKLKEMAKKAGMSVAEYKQKFASKIGGAASKVGEKVYDAAGGSHKKNAEGWRKMAQEESNAARASEKSSHENSARAASQDRKYGSGGDVYRRAADSDKENAETHRSNAKGRSERAASEQAAYEKSLAGKYDKMKADRARKKSARQDKAFSGTSPKEKKRVARKDQYLALPEQKKRSRVYDNKDAETRRARAERLTRDSEIFNRAAEESKRKQNSALNKGNKHEAEVHGKDAQFAQNWAEEGRRGAKDWRTGRRTGKPVLRTDSLDQVKKQHDKTLSGKIDKARHTIQRGKQKVYNAAGRYDEFKEKRKKKKAKHFDDTNAIYTEGTRLVVNSKWG